MSGTFSGYPEKLDILERFADGVGYPSATAINILADAGALPNRTRAVERAQAAS